MCIDNLPRLILRMGGGGGPLLAADADVHNVSKYGKHGREKESPIIVVGHSQIYIRVFCVVVVVISAFALDLCICERSSRFLLLFLHLINLSCVCEYMQMASTPPPPPKSALLMDGLLSVSSL